MAERGSRKRSVRLNVTRRYILNDLLHRYIDVDLTNTYKEEINTWLEEHADN